MWVKLLDFTVLLGFFPRNPFFSKIYGVTHIFLIPSNSATGWQKGVTLPVVHCLALPHIAEVKKPLVIFCLLYNNSRPE